MINDAGWIVPKCTAVDTQEVIFFICFSDHIISKFYKSLNTRKVALEIKYLVSIVINAITRY